jgi:hypothetical protein
VLAGCAMIVAASTRAATIDSDDIIENTCRAYTGP